MSDDVAPVSMLGVDQLATALAKAQATIVGAEKSRTNPAFKSKYATLADVWDACRKPLTDNGLSVVQLVRATSGGVEVETRLLHASGQSLSATLEVPVDKHTAQGIGSAVTYARRYGLSAMVGVAPDEDDDGHAATQYSRRDDYRHDDRREPARPEPAPSVDEKRLDAELMAAVKAVTGYLPEQTVASLRKTAALPAVPAKLTVDQKQVFLRSLQQKLKTLEDADPT